MAETNEASGGGSPASTQATFHDARDGKTAEPPKDKLPTQQQQRAADKVVQLQNQPPTPFNHAAEKSAKAALSFNVRADGLAQSKSTVEPKRQPQPTYKGKDGQVYTSPTAITAAQNLDNTKTKQAENQQTTIAKHTAPAPTPPGVARDAKRGRSIAQTQTPNKGKDQPRPENDNSKLTAMQQRILAQSRQQANQQSKSQAKEMGR